MSRILVVDDDPDMRNLVGACLKADGHAVEFAADGVGGIAAALRSTPELIVTDFQMPRMDGFALFNAVRANAVNAPVVMVTAHQSRVLMQKALSLGIDDVLGKPFSLHELRQVVAARLAPVTVPPALARPEAPVPVARAPVAPPPVVRVAPPTKAPFTGSIVCCQVCRLKALALRLETAELTELFDRFAADVNAVVQGDGGWLVRPEPHRLLVAFHDQAHAQGALRGALKMVLAAQRLKPWIARRFPGRDLPEFLVAVGVHTGPIQARLPKAGGEGALTGDAVDTATFLAGSILSLRWSVAASRATAEASAFAFLCGRSAQLRTVAGGAVEALEVKGFQPPAAAAAPDKSAALVEAAVDGNAKLVTFAAAIPAPAAPAAKAAPPPAPAAKTVRPSAPVAKAASVAAAPAKPVAAPAARPAAKSPAKPAAAHPSTDPFAGRSVARKLADNGVVAVLLVNPMGSAQQEVVKTILINDDRKRSERAQLKKFVDQYAAMQATDHPNIGRILGRGLSATHLFVIQEYCPGGDLQNLIAQRMGPDDAIKVLLRVATALKAAHQNGFIHGDLRPANVMLREDGSIAVVDFALASAVEYAIGEGDSGVMLRSPEYLAPETINGQPADVRSDIYTLGLLLHEMLTGQKAYASPDLSRVMMDQLSGPVPTLPAPHEKFQPLLDKLMAKKVEARFARVAEVISFMTEAKLQA